MHLEFKEWLSQTSPEGGGDIWNNNSNVGHSFGRVGVKSKYGAQDKSGQAEIDPKKLFFGSSKKKYRMIDIK